MSQGNPRWSNTAQIITQAYDSEIKEFTHELQEAVEATIEAIDRGEVCVVERERGGDGETWRVNEWTKKAILLYFRMRKIEIYRAGDLTFFDKIPLKRIASTSQFRVVPHAVVRHGTYIGKGVILMPSYVNIGAFVDEGSLVDTWATVGSCARIGKGVHLSGGVGIGGVLEPPQAKPVIIGDHAFIGSRAIIVEGVEVGEGAVVAAGTILTSSTRIIDVRTREAETTRGRIPPRAVVISGTSEKEMNGHRIQIPCAYIIGSRKDGDPKVSLNQVLRDFDVTV
jgi:2,3,4,5-tetrahydropyridine-2-carboxylate N-succinyltransferase